MYKAAAMADNRVLRSVTILTPVHKETMKEKCVRWSGSLCFDMPAIACLVYRLPQC